MFSIRQKYRSKVKNNRTNAPLVFELGNVAEKTSKRMVKVFILMICFGGFTYQLIDFLSFYYSYPVEVEYLFPAVGNFVAPDIEICNANRISRTKYCDKYPEDCEDMTEHAELRIMNPQFREASNLMFPTKIRSLTYNDSDLLDGLKVVLFRNPNEYRARRSELLFKRNCFSVIAGGYKTHKEVDATSGKMLLLLSAGVNFSEASSFVSSPSVVLRVYPPFQMRSQELILKIGHTYELSLDLEEERLLPKPYETDCHNYTSEWLKNNKTGPLGVEDCLDSCEQRIIFDECGCFESYQRHIHVLRREEKECKTWEEDYCSGVAFQLTKLCPQLCKRSCVRRKYNLNIDNSRVAPREFLIGLSIHWAYRPVTIVNFKPVFQDVELYSHMGGYLGLWLGVCVFACFDWISSFVKCIILFTKMLFRSCSREMRDKYNMLKLISG